MSNTNHPQNPDFADLAWFKSSYSEGGNGQCVEVAEGQAALYVRDSKAGERGPVIGFPAAAWSSFIADVRGGDGSAA